MQDLFSADVSQRKWQRFLVRRAIFIVVIVLVSGCVGTSQRAFRAAEYTITVKNNCDYQLYVRGLSQQETLQPVTLAQTASYRYELDMSQGKWIAGRIYGCWENVPDSKLQDGIAMQMSCGLTEMSITNTDGAANADITFVDAISIPLRMSFDNGFACNPSSCSISTIFSEQQVQRNCPTKLNGKSCLSMNTLCTNATYGNPRNPLCAALDGVIQKCINQYSDCAGARGSNTVDVYGCSGSFFSNPGGRVPAGEKYCAAINRGVLATADNQTNPSAFYRTTPYNEYAAFVHQIAGSIYAFPYDDYPAVLEASGDLGVQKSTGLTVEFCPS